MWTNETARSSSVVLSISGMSCGSCRRRVEEALRGVAGVERAEVDLSGARAYVNLTEGARVEALIEAVEAVGYGARLLAGAA